jgi:hypothetical protein
MLHTVADTVKRVSERRWMQKTPLKLLKTYRRGRCPRPLNRVKSECIRMSPEKWKLEEG